MKVERVLTVGLAGCVLSTAGIIMSIANFAAREEAVNAELTEQIQLDICLLDSEEAYVEERLTGLLPGTVIERKTAVILDGTSPDAYIRVGLEIAGDRKEAEGKWEKGEENEQAKRIRELQNGIRFCDGWSEGDDGFYYYQERVVHGSIIPVYERIVIPENWDNHMAEQVFTIELSAEAVRADALEPWFSERGEEVEIRNWD